MEYYKKLVDSFSDAPVEWAHQEFEQCTFKKIDLSRIALSKSNFINCRFEACILAHTGLKDTQLTNVEFSMCNLSHVDFGVCNPFGFQVNFQKCLLNYAIFANCNLKKAHFDECSIRESYFLECELTGALFKHCDLELTKFEHNNLSQVDFSSSFNLQIEPDENKLKKAKFSLCNLPGLLSKYELIIKE